MSQPGAMMEEVLRGYRRLACAVLVRAWKDAHNTNGTGAAVELGLPPGVTLSGDARAFLQGDGARWLAALLEFNPGGLDRALGSDCGNNSL